MESNAVVPLRDDAVDPLAETSDAAANISAISAPPIDLWERIRNGFSMDELDSEEVRNNEDFYASHPRVHKARRRSRQALPLPYC